jgi:hypothetical protein
VIDYAKLAGLAALAAGLLSLGFYFGAMHGDEKAATMQADASAAHAAQLGAVVAALETQRNAALAESGRRQGVIDAYDKTKGDPSPVVAGLADRVYHYAARAGCNSVPGAATVASGTPPFPALAASDQRIERLRGLTRAVFVASADDAAQMTAMIDFAAPWPTSSKKPP